MNPYEINDIRKNFNGISFSKFKKTAVRDQLISAMASGKIEPACYWCAELVCAGHYMDLWETIMYYMAKHIHLANPKIAIYLEMRMQIFRNIVAQGNFVSELHLRNSPNVRSLFAEVICILTFSNRKHSFEAIKIDRVEEFDITQMTDRFKAPSVAYAEPVFRKDDPKELYIAVNELAYSVDARNMLNACYWIEWIIEFDTICRKRKEPVRCEIRTEAAAVEAKFKHDVIWLVWDVLVNAAMTRPANSEFLCKIIQANLSLFSVKYTTASAKRRKYLLYFSVSILTETVDMTVDIVNPAKKERMQTIIGRVNEIYRQVKRNEESGGTNYLLDSLGTSMEQMMQQMNLMNSIDAQMQEQNKSIVYDPGFIDYDTNP